MSGTAPAQQGPPPMPRDFEELEFSIEEERWNEYTLQDGARVQGRIILTKIIRNPFQHNMMSFDFSNPVWAVYAPSALRGEPSRGSITPQDIPNLPKFEVHTTTSHEPWNKYRIPRTGQRLKIKLAIDEVFRLVDKFDQHGNPIYHVPHAISINLSPPTRGDQ